MTTRKESKSRQVLRKTVLCLSVSTFYFALLAWPFGLTEHGYIVTRALLAGLVMFAISIPVWVVNIKRELKSVEGGATEGIEEVVTEAQRIGQLAMRNKWLSPAEVRQIMYCQRTDGKKFGQVAVKRNFLTINQVKSLLNMQSEASHSHAVDTIH